VGLECVERRELESVPKEASSTKLKEKRGVLLREEEAERRMDL